MIILPASQNGNTLKCAKIIQNILQEEFKMESIIQSPEQISLREMKEHDIWLLGSSTWGNGDLHRNIDKLERVLRDQNLEGIWGASFGCGNSMYPHFCEAVDILETRLRNSGARIIQKGLKLDTLTGFDQSKVEDWARWLGERLR